MRLHSSIITITFSMFFTLITKSVMADETIRNSSKKQYSKISILSGLITHVRDGDTIIVGSIPIRLAALNCPEKNTTKGMIATKIALKFIGQAADCKLTGVKTYDRFVAYCSMNGKDFGQYMIQNSSCKPWKKFDIWNKY